MTKKITVLGGGPGGYVAALKAAIMGAEVTLIEKDTLGGTCLNRGCIPTKAFLMSAGVKETAEHAGDFGIHCGEAQAEFGEILDRKNQVVGQLVGGVGFLLKKRKVKVVSGHGKLLAGTAVAVTSADGTIQTIDGDAVILAAGSVPLIPPMFPYDGKRVITSDEALSLKKAPESILIVGGGVIGCELGQFLRKMGSSVSIVEMADHILPSEDEDVAAEIGKTLKADGIKVCVKTKVDGVDVTEDGVCASLSDGQALKAECLLVSIGRKANLERLVDKSVAIETKNGKIVVDDKMRTNIPGVYAIGDLVNTPFLAHVASREGTVAVETILGRESRAVYHAVPRCLYTHPEVGAVGMTETAAAESGISYKKGMFYFAGIGKALVMGQTAGFVKVLTDEKDRLIGASVVGPNATDLLTELTLAVHLGLTAAQVGEVIHPHPTLSEALMEALHDVHKESVHSF